MTAEHLRNGSTPVQRTCVSGMEWNGMEEEWRGVSHHPYVSHGSEPATTRRPAVPRRWMELRWIGVVP